MTERARMPRSGVSEIQALRPNGTYYHIDVLATNATNGTAFATNVIRISTTVDICYDIDTSPVAVGATTSGATTFLPAGGVEYVKVKSTDQIGVIAQDETTAGGVVYIAEMH